MKTLTKRTFSGALVASAVTAMVVAGTAGTASAEEFSVRFGPYATSWECELGREEELEYGGPDLVRVGACWQYGPGAAGWYFYGYYEQ